MKKSARLFFCLIFISGKIFAQVKTRSLSELINKTEPAWTTLVQPWIKEAKNHIEVLPKDSLRADSGLYNAQITTRSPMGAIIYETGGIFIDHGWIRILGSGCSKMNRDVMSWNLGKTYAKRSEDIPYLLIADDVLGGFFAINAGGIDSAGIGKVFYAGADQLPWLNTNMTYTDFIMFCFTGNLKSFYKGLYWTGWEEDIKSIDGNKGVYCFPFLCTKEGADINKVQRTVVPIGELWINQENLRTNLAPK